MPIEKGGYRAWKGKTRGLTHRIFSIANCELRYRLKRPAIIVVLAILGLYTVTTGLIPILGNLIGGENMFVNDPNLYFNPYQVPDIVVTGVSISNTSDTLEHIEPGLELFELGLEPGQTAVYQLEITNAGTRSGSFKLMLGGNSGTNAWIIRLLEGSIPLDKRSENPPDAAVDYNGTRTRQSDGKRQLPGDSTEINGDNKYGNLVLDLDSGSSKTISIKVSLVEDTVTFDTLALSLSVSNNNDNDWFVGEEDIATQFKTKVRLDLFTKITWPATSLKSFMKVELTGVKDSSGTWSGDRIKNIYHAPPEVRWEDTVEFTFRITNADDQTVYVKRLHDPDSDYYRIQLDDEFGGSNTTYGDSNEEEPKEIKSDESETFTVIVNPYIEFKPGKSYLQLIFMASENEGSFDQDIIQSSQKGGGGGMNLNFTSVPYMVISYTQPVDDWTAEYFFNTFYTGGINIWVILLAVLGGSGLIADDRANKTLPLYYSKAIPKYGYLAGKFLGLAALIGLVTVVWSNLWVAIIMLVGGFSWQFFTSHAWIMGAFTLYGLIITFFMSALVLGASSLAKNRYVVGASVFALFLITAIMGGIISAVTREYNYLMLSPSANFIFIGTALFDLGTPEVDWGYALMTLGGIFIFFIGVLYWQLVKREVSIE
ncbi:MAG: ABC transporter permease subunit [Candidatus Thermoplasmatota archaeon]|nr:ABC transporter permease subunit [Candidatus Thermoplasmatota archaeon]MDP7265553.1 ABC transporter permease subunit [Candidatus Thermoplasmatota archaeon]